MDQNHNPYASPLEATGSPVEVSEKPRVVPAGSGARLGNFLIDYAAQFGVSFAFGIGVVVVGGEEGVLMLERIPSVVLGFAILLFYYVILEAATGRTLGKLITGTKVVNEDGGAPSIGQIIGRTLCRCIPFEAFSFLSSDARGWHDRIPKTYVVKAR